MIEGQELRGACSPSAFNGNPAQVRAMVDLFFEEDDLQVIAYAKSICAGCVVRAECLDIGMSERFGIRGGLTPQERRSLRKTVKM